MMRIFIIFIYPRFNWILCNLIGQIIEEENTSCILYLLPGILIYKLVNRGCRSLERKSLLRSISRNYSFVISVGRIYGTQVGLSCSRSYISRSLGNRNTRRPSPRGSAILGRGWERVIGFPWRQKTPRSKTSSRSKLHAAVTRGEERGETRNEDSEALRSYYH